LNLSCINKTNLFPRWVSPSGFTPPTSAPVGSLVSYMAVLKATKILQAPLPASMWLLSDQYAAEVQLYYSEYPANPQRESPFEIENPASGPPDLNKMGIRTFGCPTQFKDAGLERDCSYDDMGKLRNPKPRRNYHQQLFYR
jgi:hypothetical protein